MKCNDVTVAYSTFLNANPSTTGIKPYFFSPLDENHASGQVETFQAVRLSCGSWQDCLKKRTVLTLLVKSAKMSKAGGKRGKMGSICQDPGSRVLERVLNLFGTRDQLCGSQFFHGPGVGGRQFQDDSSTLHLLCTLSVIITL